MKLSRWSTCGQRDIIKDGDQRAGIKTDARGRALVMIRFANESNCCLFLFSAGANLLAGLLMSDLAESGEQFQRTSNRRTIFFVSASAVASLTELLLPMLQIKKVSRFVLMMICSLDTRILSFDAASALANTTSSRQ